MKFWRVCARKLAIKENGTGGKPVPKERRIFSFHLFEWDKKDLHL
jgi:hypothetical protein